jgi:hypothetical protein
LGAALRCGNGSVKSKACWPSNPPPGGPIDRGDILEPDSQLPTAIRRSWKEHRADRTYSLRATPPDHPVVPIGPERPAAILWFDSGVIQGTTPRTVTLGWIPQIFPAGGGKPDSNQAHGTLNSPVTTSLPSFGLGLARCFPLGVPPAEAFQNAGCELGDLIAAACGLYALRNLRSFSGPVVGVTDNRSVVEFLSGRGSMTLVFGGQDAAPGLRGIIGGLSTGLAHVKWERIDSRRMAPVQSVQRYTADMARWFQRTGQVGTARGP